MIRTPLDARLRKMRESDDGREQPLGSKADIVEKEEKSRERMDADGVMRKRTMREKLIEKRTKV